MDITHDHASYVAELTAAMLTDERPRTPVDSTMRTPVDRPISSIFAGAFVPMRMLWFELQVPVNRLIR